MTRDVADRETQVVRRLLGTDSPGDLADVVGLFGTFLLLDRLTSQLAALSDYSLHQPVLSVSAFHQQPFLASGLICFYRGRTPLPNSSTVEQLERA